MTEPDLPQRVHVDSGSDQAAPGACIRFSLELDGLPTPAFAILTSQGWRAYVDRCRHLPLTLEPGLGGLSPDGGSTLTCARHFASYEATTGVCLVGPCKGRALTPLRLEQRDGGLWCLGLASPRTER